MNNMEIPAWLGLFIPLGIVAFSLGIISIVMKFQRLFLDMKYFKEDIKKLQDEIIELKYKRND